jgi:hypothetical protein
VLLPDPVALVIWNILFISRQEAISKIADHAQGQSASRRKRRCFQHRCKYVSILRRFDERLNVHNNRCEIPLTPAGQRRHWVLDAF